MINPTHQTLVEQMQLNEFEIEHRKAIISLTDEDVARLLVCKPTIEIHLEEIISEFYEHQTSIPEIAVIIGDANTLGLLKNTMRRYILDLFSGVYDLEYANHRCRIGLVHKRIGVEPKLYLSSTLFLKELLRKIIDSHFTDEEKRKESRIALDKLLMFDVTLIFETYIRSLIAEVETAKARSDQYALSLEEKVRVRTQQLDKLARLDPLTGLLNIRQLNEVLTTVLRSAERQHEATTVVYIDVNDFKIINDTHGHQQGDEILQTVSEAIKGCARVEDYCFRYGGDEFLVILKNCTEQQARDIYLVALEKKMCAVGVSLSAGLAQTGPEHFVDGMALIKRADENMYVFKKAHKAAKKENLNI